MAEPFLYKEIQWYWERQNKEPPPITQLLRTLVFRPHLAVYVRKLHMDGHVYTRYENRHTCSEIAVPCHELDDLIAAIQRTGVPFRDTWIQELRHGSIYAVVALLLAQLPNLRCLYLNGAFTRQTTVIGMVLRSALCEPNGYELPKFQHLQEVSFLMPQWEDEARDALAFFYLRNIERISALIENAPQFKWPGVQPPLLSKLKALDLTHIRQKYLGKLLLVTPNLTSLRWFWYYDLGVRDDFITRTVELDQIPSALSHVRSSLTELTLKAACEAGANTHWYPGVKVNGSLSGIADFDMVKRFQVPLVFLVGFSRNPATRLRDVVPRNVELLIITDDLKVQNVDDVEPDCPQWEWDDCAIINSLSSWPEDAAEFTPHLRQVRLLFSDIWHDENEWPSEMRDRLREVGARVGVQVELIDLQAEM
ncbi:hypothetical protein BJX63DRAFT_437001 [Aspergillus granulosus]|uniref:Uncharacterized protein n=1 Tax=Aspergillus granulosus TaxID=176169 RepID=A0ABR4GWH3_9EURO